MQENVIAQWVPAFAGMPERKHVFAEKAEFQIGCPSQTLSHENFLDSGVCWNDEGAPNTFMLLGGKGLEQQSLSLCGFFDHFPADVDPAHEIVACLAFQDRFSDRVIGCNR